MCIAILQPADKQVDDAILRRCWDKNPHGGGFMYSNGERMIVVKEMRSADHFLKHLGRHAHKIVTSKSPVLYHFRWATHGAKDIKNCHPFLITSKLGFAHNGVFSWIPDNKVTSDTYEFNQGILKALPSNFMSNSAIMELLDDYVGFSKLVFLDVEGKYAILNETQGDWYEGCWYSNGGYKEAPPATEYKRWEGHCGWNSSEYESWTQTKYGIEATRKDPETEHPTVPTRLLGAGNKDGVRELNDDDYISMDVNPGDGKIDCDFCGCPIYSKVDIFGDNYTTHPWCRKQLLKQIHGAN